jgi:general secretion pathway protein L
MAILARSALGLDLGSHSVKLVEFRQTLRGVEVGALHALPSVDPADPRPPGERLRALLRMHGLRTDSVVCAVPADRLTGRRLRFPFRERRRLAQAVPLAVEDELPFDLERFLVGWEVVGANGGSESRVVASAAPRDEVAQLLAAAREAGLDPRIVEAEGLVLANLAGFFELPRVGVLADLGHRKTTLCLVADGAPLASRAIPIGGRALTEALARERGLDLAAAEQLKCERGLEAGSPALAEMLDRLLRELVRSLGAFEPALADTGASRPEQIVLLGGGAHLHGIERHFGERLALPVRRLSAPPGEDGRALLAAGDPALFGPAAALALRGTGRARTRTNFRQAEFARRLDVGRIGRELAWTGGLAGVALALGAAWVVTSTALHARRAQAFEGEVARLYADAFPGSAPPANALSAMQAAVRAAQDRADFLGVYRGNLSALDLLAEISARVPKELELVFEELAIDRQVVRIRGHCQSFEAVDRLRAELAEYPPFQQIKLSEVTTDRDGVKSFSATISLADGVPAS